MRYLFVLHDAPYGTERVYNGLRWAREMLQGPGSEARMFFFADAVAAAKSGQHTPNGYYNVGKMVAGVAAAGAEVGCCGSCLDARGIGDEELVKGTHRSSMSELAEWTAWADQVINI
ncbi:DsrE family protein [Blastococcus sp. HT6-4]|uniref:DsrE/DsrF/TusD sulfur relay family protein n=1 Tax=Blastococcus montanus TaxID=3144973 RepID=UPI00320A8E13